MFSVFINWVCGTIFTLVGYSCYISRRPVGFWSGSSVKKEEVTDVKKYNNANGIMWCIYASIYWIAGICAFFSEGLATIFTIIGCTVGLAALIIGYNFIKRRFFIKYRDKYLASRLNDFK